MQNSPIAETPTNQTHKTNSLRDYVGSENFVFNVVVWVFTMLGVFIILWITFLPFWILLGSVTESVIGGR